MSRKDPDAELGKDPMGSQEDISRQNQKENKPKVKRSKRKPQRDIYEYLKGGQKRRLLKVVVSPNDSALEDILLSRFEFCILMDGPYSKQPGSGNYHS